MNEKNNKRTIFGWSMYDWAKSAYETTILGAVLPVYFVSVIVPEEGFEFRGNVYTGAEVWGFAIGSALFIFFLIMPTIGAIADMSGNRMRFFKIFAFGGAFYLFCVRKQTKITNEITKNNKTQHENNERNNNTNHKM